MPQNNDVATRKTIAAPNLDAADYDALSRFCLASDLQLINENVRNYPGGLEMSITMINCGLAETGTLVLNSDSEETRLSTMLCETHVAILKNVIFMKPHRMPCRFSMIW